MIKIKGEIDHRLCDRPVWALHVDLPPKATGRVRRSLRRALGPKAAGPHMQVASSPDRTLMRGAAISARGLVLHGAMLQPMAAFFRSTNAKMSKSRLIFRGNG